MIISEITENQFIREFDEYNRSNNFSVEGRTALYNYLMECYTEDNPFNLDIIGLCCDFTEYKNIKEYVEDYRPDIDPQDYELTNDLKNSDPQDIDHLIYEQNLEDYKQAIEEHINHNTTLIKFDDDLNEGFIIGCY